MAEPKLQIEQRLDNIERAVGTMAQWLVQAQTGFNAKDAEGIEQILRGEKREDDSGGTGNSVQDSSEVPRDV